MTYKEAANRNEDHMRIHYLAEGEQAVWIAGMDYECSACHTLFSDEIEFINKSLMFAEYPDSMPRYCPHCGARMSGVLYKGGRLAFSSDETTKER